MATAKSCARRGRRPLLFAFIGAVLFGFTATGSFYFFFPHITTEDCGSVAVEPLIQDPDRASFIAAGDNLIHEAIFRQAYRRGGDHYDFDYAYANTAGYFQDFDFRYINQETLVNDYAAPSGYPRFSSPPAVGDKVVAMGFNIIGTANNHSYDVGDNGISNSYAYWDRQPNLIHTGFYTGDDAKDIKYITKNNITLAFISCTYGTNGLVLYDDDSPYVISCENYTTLDRQVKLAKTHSDAVIVSAHWGTENVNYLNSYQHAVADHLANLDVDVIIGNHPHVLQPVEWHANHDGTHKTLICYSLGNFISAQREPNNLIAGLFRFDIVKTYRRDAPPVVTFENPRLVPTVTHYDYGFTNIRNYLFRDYNATLASAHGASGWGFSYRYASNLIRDVIPAEFLDDF